MASFQDFIVLAQTEISTRVELEFQVRPGYKYYLGTVKQF